MQEIDKEEKHPVKDDELKASEHPIDPMFKNINLRNLDQIRMQ